MLIGITRGLSHPLQNEKEKIDTLRQGWRTYSTRAQNGMRENFLLSIFLFLIPDLFFFPVALRPNASHYLILEVSGSHTQRRITVGRTPLDEWSARRRDLYLTTHNTHNRWPSMPPVGFEPTISAGERPQTYALDRASTAYTRPASLYSEHMCIYTHILLHRDCK